MASAGFGGARQRQGCSTTARVRDLRKLIENEGQSTLAALMACELRSEEKYSSGNSAVASIFADEMPIKDWHETHLEAVLTSILCQLSHHHESHPRAECHDALQLGELGDKRISKLRDALSCRLQQLESAFLILDGVDQCGWSTACCLENIILGLHMQHPHFRALLTSRTLLLRSEVYGRCSNACRQPDPRARFSSDPEVQKRIQLVYPTYLSAAEICGQW